MARYNIKGVNLASRLDVGPNAISALRNAKTMPRLDGVALNSLCNALNELACDLDKPITPADLLDYSQDSINAPEADKVFSLIKRHNKKAGKNETSGQPVDGHTANAS
jgi:DNA-binding Xre family transcriptional regulator